ncbi:hypothetical protein AX15_006241 [Amanita polypyramis BW_CC]|nr:hypothetical protein AX15_006241 [Amanita polypyramis BW_CC]
MPAHPILALHDPPSLDLPVPQLGVCVKCQSTLDTSGPIAAPGVGTFVCSACRELLLLSSPRDPSDAREVRFDINLALVRLPSHDNPPSTRPIPDLDDSMLLGDVVNQRVSDHSRTSSDASSKPSTPLRKPALSCITTTSVSSVAPLSHSLVHHVTSTTASTVVIDSRRQNGKCMVPDPLIDITRLRIRTSSHYCLYPGATFVGTQKSGRSSYDVTVTVVDVDFASSFLCGYLRIRGLTDDWPELTTYFDAEIIGNRYGFLTQNWGASENDDMIHWSRFPAFKQIRPELREPMLTMTDRDRGAVFMRWKERFLVPDHRVQDISGASFAGFYYVCVDFNPPPNHSTLPTSLGSCKDDSAGVNTLPSSPRRTLRNASRRRGRSPSISPLSIPVATMNGFYYHQNSEP